MPNRDAPSGSPDQRLACRMAMLGLDRSAIDVRSANVFNIIRHRCANCEFAETCEIDLQRDPNDPAWESYCPNTPTFIALSEAWWPT